MTIPKFDSTTAKTRYRIKELIFDNGSSKFLIEETWTTAEQEVEFNALGSDVWSSNAIFSTETLEECQKQIDRTASEPEINVVSYKIHLYEPKPISNEKT